MITIDSVKEIMNKSLDKISILEEKIFSLEKDIEFERAKIVVCEEMIANEENESEQEEVEQHETYESCESIIG